MRRKVWVIEFEPYDDERHTSHHEDLRSGTIVVRYTNGTFEEFPKQTRKSFFEWESTNFDLKQIPDGVRVLPPILDAEDLPEPEEHEEEEEPRIHPNDYIGQVTGFQTWNYKLDEDGNLLQPQESAPAKPKQSKPERLSTYHGVFWLDDKWLAAIQDRNEWVILGKFDSEIAAADYHDCAAYRYIGKNAKRNFPGNQTVFVFQGQ